MSKKNFFLFLLILLVFPATIFAKLTVIVPKDYSVTENSTITIVGAEDSADKEDITITVRGLVDDEPEEFSEDVGIYDREFNLAVDLFEGENEIIVGNVPIMVFYNDGTLTTPGNYKEEFYHQVIESSGCSDCHDTEAEGLPLVAEKTVICKECHPQYLKIEVTSTINKSGKIITKKKEILYANLHKPILEGKCLACHKPHSSNSQLLLKDVAVFFLCEECHEEIFDALSISEEPHPPQEQGECIKCHSAHASEEKYLFKKSLKFICFNCHESFVEGVQAGEKKSTHRPARAGACYECHDLHFSEMDTSFINISKKVICIRCHEDKNAGMHVDVKKGCLTCHLPHFSDFESLLRSDEMGSCKECHEDVLKGEVVHSAMKEPCQACHGKLHELKEIDETKKNCFKCHTDLEYIKVTHYDYDISKEKCSSCHRSHSSSGAMLLGKEQHPPFKDRECDLCHEEAKGESKLIKTGAGLCYQCHDSKGLTKNKKPLKHLHTPVKKGECTGCHNPHSAEYEKFLIAPGNKLCFECHNSLLYNEKGKKFKILHPPAENAECDKCHAAHGSMVDKNLNDSIRNLCFNCHDDFAENISDEARIHPPYEDGNCSACHSSHGTDFANLIKKNQIKICAQCHDDKTKDGSGNPYSVVHKPVAEGNCSKCHMAHIAKYEKQLDLEGNALCINCHEKIWNHHVMKYESNNPSVVIEKGFKREGNNFSCIGCHSPHASNAEDLFYGTKKAMCRRCHN
jgi:predicted CXXCH cytochrome family protein